jgi:hypothetical protein
MSKSKLSLICIVILLAMPLMALAQRGGGGGGGSKGAAPTISSISPDSATAGGADFVLTVTGANFSLGSVVRWNGSNLTTAYVSASQLQASIPSALISIAGTAQITVFTSGRGGGTSDGVAFTVAAGAAASTASTASTSALAITTTSVSAGTVGTSYSATLAASGGTSPYSWSISSGALPSGLALSTAGAISGTPTASGTYAFTAQVADSASHSATQAYSMSVLTAPLAISTASVPAATAGEAYSATLAASGGNPPHGWSISGGALPPGLSMSSSGAIAGTPTTSGSYTFTAQVTDAASSAATHTYSLTANAAAPTVGTGSTVYASWAGIDAMPVPTTYYADTTPNGAQIGGSNWQWQHGNGNHTTTLTVTNSSYEPLCPTGHNCVVFQYATSDGTNGFPNYIYLSPTYSGWAGDPTQVNGSNPDGGVWMQFYYRIDSDTQAYLSNGPSQIKLFLGRYDASGNYTQSNTNTQSDGGGGFFMPLIGWACGYGGPNYACIYDDATTGSTMYAGANYPANALSTAGALIKGHFRRDTSARLGHFSVSVNGVDTANTVTGFHDNCATKPGGCSVLGTNNTGQVMGFQIGIRYFAACTNGCANTTLKVVISDVAVANYNFAGYP